MIAMDVDDSYIACLYVEMDNRKDAPSDIIISAVRGDDFILLKDIDEDDVTFGSNKLEEIVIYAGEAFLEYIKNHEGFEDITGPLTEHEARGGNKFYISVYTAGNICACGNGHFMVELVVAVPVPGSQTATSHDMGCIGRRLVVFSVVTESIVWTGHYLHILDRNMFDGRRVTMSSRKVGDKVVVAITNTADSTIFIGDVLPNTFQDGNTLTLTLHEANHYPNRKLCNVAPRSIAVLDSCIVTTEFWIPKSEDDLDPDIEVSELIKSTCTIHRPPSGSDISYTNDHMEIPERFYAFSVVDLGDNYIGVLCTENQILEFDESTGPFYAANDGGNQQLGFHVREFEFAMPESDEDDDEDNDDDDNDEADGNDSIQREDEDGGDKKVDSCDDSDVNDEPGKVNVDLREAESESKDEEEGDGDDEKIYIGGDYYDDEYNDDDDEDEDQSPADGNRLTLFVLHVDPASCFGVRKTRRRSRYTVATMPQVARNGNTIAVASFCNGVAMTGKDIY
jgi:hypothetical protein